MTKNYCDRCQTEIGRLDRNDMACVVHDSNDRAWTIRTYVNDHEQNPPEMCDKCKIHLLDLAIEHLKGVGVRVAK